MPELSEFVEFVDEKASVKKPSLVEKLFSEKQDVVWTAIVSKTEKRRGEFNPKMEMVLGFKP